MAPQVTKRLVVFSVALLTSTVILSSCRATSPTAAALKSGQTKADEPVAAEKPEPQEILRWVVATRLETGDANGSSSWNLDLKTESEMWCEARCSKFELVENTHGGVSELHVKKTSIVGNTSPGMLDVKKEIKTDRAKKTKLQLLNVGSKGQTIVLENMVTKDRPNFYAVPMMIAPRADGLKSVVTGDFLGKTIEVRMEKNAALPTVLTRGTAPIESFVMGSLVEEKDSSGKLKQVFWAIKILPSAEE